MFFYCRYVDFSMEFDLLPQVGYQLNSGQIKITFNQFQSNVFNGLCLLLFRKVGPHIRYITFC